MGGHKKPRSLVREVMPLVREVLPPQRAQSGVGVMLVAATAMFFAVASSAFILRARMAQTCCPMNHRAAPMLFDIGMTLEEETPKETPRAPGQCGSMVTETNPDGTVTVRFDVCPSDQAIDLDTRLDTQTAQITGVQVGEVVIRPSEDL